jgi:hypothetical protein
MRTLASASDPRLDRARLFSASLAIGLQGAVVLLWLVAVMAMLVTDVWDESRSLNLIQGHGFFELVSSNWKPGGLGGVVLFRPLPMFLFTAIAKLLDNFEVAWRVLRLLNAGFLLLGLGFALSFLRRVGGIDRVRDLLLTVAFLWSGSALISAGWFANIFDVGVFVLMMLGLQQLAAEQGFRAGVAFGAAFFCKENAVLVFPLLAVLLCTGVTNRKATIRALSISGAVFAVYIALRFAFVAPGSPSDLKEISAAGVLSAGFRLPETLWWQVADVPVPWLGSLLTVVAICLVRSFRARLGCVAVLAVAALVYGELVHLGPSPLMHPDNFVGRLYLVPAAILLLMLAVFGRRWSLAFVILPLVWGGVLTVDRHIRFQQAYRAVYRTAEGTGARPLQVDSRLYWGSRRFFHEYRGVEFGQFPDAMYRLQLDGRLVNTSLEKPDG